MNEVARGAREYDALIAGGEVVDPGAGLRGSLDVAIRDGRGQVLVGQRPETARWAGMWELPHDVMAPGEDSAGAAARIARTLADLRVRTGGELATVRHTVTRHAITVTAVEARAGKGSPRSTFYNQLRWVAPSRLADLPAGTPQRKLFAALARTPRPVRQS